MLNYFCQINFLCFFVFTSSIALAETAVYRNDIYKLSDGLYERKYFELAIEEYKKLTLSKDISKKRKEKAYFYSAQAYYQLKNYKKALDSLKLYLKQFPNSIYSDFANLLQTNILISQNKKNDAILVLKKLLINSKNKNNIERANFTLAKIYYDKNEIKKAKEAFSQIPVRDISKNINIRSPALFYLSNIKKSEGKLWNAIKGYKYLLLIKKVSVKIKINSLFYLGMSYMQLGEYKYAIDTFDAFIFNYSNSKILSSVYIQKVYAVYYSGDYKKTLDAINTYMKKFNLINLGTDLLFIKIDSLMKVKYFTEVKKLCDKILLDLDKKENNKRALRYLLSSLIQMKDYKVYIQYFSKYNSFFSSKDAGMPDLYYFAAIASKKIKDKPNAIQYFKKALQLKPVYWEYRESAMNSLASLYFDSKQYLLAGDLFYQSAKFNKNINMYLKSAECFIELKDYKKVLELYMQAIKLKGITVKTLNSLVIRIAKIKESTESEESSEEFLLKYTRNLKNKPDANVIIALGLLELNLDKYMNAKEYFKQALKVAVLEKESTLASFYIGYVALILNDSDSAITIFKQIFKRPPIKWAEVSKILFIDVAKFLLNNKKYYIAEKIYKKVDLIINAKNFNLAVKCNIGLAECYRYTNRIDLAIKTLLLSIKKLDVLAVSTELNISKLSIYSYLGEYFFEKKNMLEAVSFFEKVMKNPVRSVDSLPRATYGLANIFFIDKEYDLALRHATCVFILYQNDYYCSKAMALALKILILTNKRLQALDAWADFKKRYPLSANEFQKDTFFNEKLIKWTK